MKHGCLISGCTPHNNLIPLKVKSSCFSQLTFTCNQLKLNPTKANQVKFFTTLAPPLAAAFLFFSPVSSAQTIDILRGASLFQQTCIGCHYAGGNIIQPGSTLFTKDLQRNGVDTEEEIYRVTYYGKGRMPGFGKECKPRGQCTFGARLEEEDIKILAEFVKLQADKGWPSIEIEDK